LEDHAIEIPCFDWQGRAIVRLSVQGYNTQAEMDRLVAALADWLAADLPA
jgi:isopenicillin-N epimerase